MAGGLLSPIGGVAVILNKKLPAPIPITASAIAAIAKRVRAVPLFFVRLSRRRFFLAFLQEHTLRRCQRSTH